MSSIQMEPLISSEVNDFLTTIHDDSLTPLNYEASPVHILFPNEVVSNLLLYKNIYKQHSLVPYIYYALKANRSIALLKKAHTQTDHVEISSPYELLQALRAGFSGPNILASGPLKSLRYLKACVEHNVMVAVDDSAELDDLMKLCKEARKLIKVLLRINYSGSKFGIPMDKVEEILAGKSRDGGRWVKIKGFAFHINNYSISDRQKMLATLINLVAFARDNRHHVCDTISIGGGFTINYVEKTTWENWQKNIQNSYVDTYNGKKFESIYPYYSPAAKEAFLDAILSFSPTYASSSTLAQLLKSNNIKLIIEPGRSLLDQAGITLFTVNGVKQAVSKYAMLIVEGNINSLSEQWFGSDFLIDPLLLARQNGRPKTTAGQYFIGGNMCLENDMLATRPIHFSQQPKRGDRIIYVNTAGYQMDSNESGFASFPPSEKLVASKANGAWRLVPDERV